MKRLGVKSKHAQTLGVCFAIYPKKYFKLNEKTEPMGIVLIIDPYSHIHLHINNILSFYLTNQILETSFTFFNNIHTCNKFSIFLIIKLYKVILYI